MTAPVRTFARPTPMRWLVWCLLFAIAVGGWSSVAVRMLGTSHHHRDPHRDHRADNLLRPGTAAMAGWQDFRRADHRLRRATTEHMAQQRHHHAVNDASVVALDTATDAAAQGDSPPTAGDGSGLMFALGNFIPRGAASTARWPVADRTALPHPHPQRLERPPQA